MKTVKIGLIGLGTVGGGVYEAIRNNARRIARKTGVLLEVAAVCDKDAKLLKKIPSSENVLKTKSASDIVKAKDIISLHANPLKA